MTLKLHLGCGEKFIPGFTHIDVIKFPNVDVVSAVDKLPMIKDDSVDLIYACHVLEHFNKKQVPAVLTEWRRMLKTEGILRLAVPNFKVLAQMYVEGKATLDQVHGPILGGQTYLYNFHYTLFDPKSLEKYLTDAGFRTIREWSWRTTEHADLDDFSQAYLPHMDKEFGTLISLNLEAVK